MQYHFYAISNIDTHIQLRELNKMPQINQNVALVIEPPRDGSSISWKAGNMFLNRLCIDEEAAFETPGIFFLESSSFWQVAHQAFRQVSKTKTADLKLHILYAGIHTNIAHGPYSEERLRQFLLKEMKKHQIKSVTMTTISMTRRNLITHEEMEKYYSSGRSGDRKVLPRKSYSNTVQREPHSQLESSPESFQNDLNSFFENLRLDEVVHSSVPTYFLPKLTEEEQSLVDKQDSNFFKTFYSLNPDIAKYKMKQSKSDSKFVLCDGYRKTFIILSNK